VTSLLDSARTSASASTATADTQQAERIIQSDAPVIWPSVPKTLVPVPDFVVGYTWPSPLPLDCLLLAAAD